MTLAQPTSEWLPLSRFRPERGQRVDWIGPSGQQVNGGKYAGMWFLPGENPMYIYYTPVYWRPSQVEAVAAWVEGSQG